MPARIAFRVAVAAWILACGAPSPAPDGAGPGPPLPAGDALLLAATKTGLPPSDVGPADLPVPTSPGAALVVRYCPQCHALPTPTMHSATDWPGILRRMWLRMDRLPATMQVQAPDEGGREVMLAYFSGNALQVTRQLRAGPGREEFVMVCSRCHALPDPRMHSPADWLAVFLRMERNMERMNVRPATQEEGMLILTYLQAGPVGR